MTQTQNPDTVKNLFPISRAENLSVTITDDNLFRLTKKDNELPQAMELPVNNYLKSHGEIETEFHYLLNSRKPVSPERNDSLEKDSLSITETVEYMNIHTIETALSGFMEENY